MRACVRVCVDGTEWAGVELPGACGRSSSARAPDSRYVSLLCVCDVSIDRSGVEWSGVEWSGVERSGVERSGVE